jgi:hypothetical protein
VGGELRETNPCISLWFASLCYFLAYLICFCFDLLGCATCVCAGVITLLVIIYQGYSSSLIRATSQEELEVVFAGALCYTGLTGARQRSDQWSSVRDQSDLSPPPIWPVDTGSSSFQEEKLELVVTPIHPPLTSRSFQTCPTNPCGSTFLWAAHKSVLTDQCGFIVRFFANFSCSLLFVYVWLLKLHLGYKSSSCSLWEELLSAPIHSPFSGRQIGPSWNPSGVILPWCLEVLSNHWVLLTTTSAPSSWQPLLCPCTRSSVGEEGVMWLACLVTWRSGSNVVGPCGRAWGASGGVSVRSISYRRKMTNNQLGGGGLCTHPRRRGWRGGGAPYTRRKTGLEGGK